LVSAFTSVRKQEGELKLLNLTNKVRDVMQITRLYTVFDIMDDEAWPLSPSVIGRGNRMTVELACGQESRRVPQASNSRKVGSPNIGIEEWREGKFYG